MRNSWELWPLISYLNSAGLAEQSAFICTLKSASSSIFRKRPKERGPHMTAYTQPFVGNRLFSPSKAAIKDLIHLGITFGIVKSWIYSTVQPDLVIPDCQRKDKVHLDGNFQTKYIAISLCSHLR